MKNTENNFVIKDENRSIIFAYEIQYFDRFEVMEKRKDKKHVKVERVNEYCICYRVIWII